MITVTGIHIDNFRGLRDFQLEGARMFNLLVGPSEIGKTSVLEAILLVLDAGSAGNLRLCLSLNTIRGAVQTENPFRDGVAGVESLFHNFQSEPISLRTEVIPKTGIGTVGFDVQIFPAVAEDGVISYQSATKEAKKIIKKSDQLLGNFDELRYRAIVSGAAQGEINRMLRLSPEGVQFPSPVVDLTVDVARIRCDACYLRHNDLRLAIQEIVQNKHKEMVVDALRAINPQIRDFGLLGDVPYVDIGLEKTSPMHITGDGVRKVISTMGYLAMPEYTVHLNDEIGEGIYFGSLKEYLRAVLLFARREKKQIFATTHSKDVLIALRNVLAEEEDLREDAAVFSFLRDKHDKIIAIPYLYGDIDHCLGSDIEIR